MSSSHPSPTNHPNTPQPQPKPQPQTTSIPKKTVPLPWSHIETVNLIEAYQEKWYSLKRGQLKASQWEEVAASVAARCGFKELSKTATQCRHKMEKLRKRYRSEKQRGLPSVWNYYDMMDLMERGPFPLSARPVSLLPPLLQRRQEQEPENEYESEDVDVDEDEDEYKSRSINHILRRQAAVPSPPIFDALPLPSKYVNSTSVRNPMYRKRKRVYENEVEEEDDEEVEEEEEGDEKGGRLLSELASVVRGFGEGFVKVENMKLELMRETERRRIEMEKKRMEMINESQRRIVETIAKTFDLHYKSKKVQEKLAE